MTKEEMREHCNNYGYSDGEVYAFKDGYQQGRADRETELKPLLNAIRFALEDYSTRLGDYAKVIDEKLKEQNADNCEDIEWRL